MSYITTTRINKHYSPSEAAQEEKKQQEKDENPDQQANQRRHLKFLDSKLTLSEDNLRNVILQSYWQELNLQRKPEAETYWNLLNLNSEERKS